MNIEVSSLGPLKNKAVTNIHVQVFVWIYAFISLGHAGKKHIDAE